MDTDWPQRVIELVDWLAIKLVDRLVYDTGTTDALFRHNEALFRSIRDLWLANSPLWDGLTKNSAATAIKRALGPSYTSGYPGF